MGIPLTGLFAEMGKGAVGPVVAAVNFELEHAEVFRGVGVVVRVGGRNLQRRISSEGENRGESVCSAE